MDFVAIDVETANADMASICQIGLAKYTKGKLTEEWVSYVNPEDYFDRYHVENIHGIDEDTVRDAPTFPEISNTVFSFLKGSVAVSHGFFDKLSINRAAERYGISEPNIEWIDSTKVTRRTWAEFSHKGYKLKNVCKMLGYEYKQHDALADAKAAAHVLLAASEKCGLDIAGWLRRVRQPLNPGATTKIARDGNPEGPLFGEVLVFTGKLVMPRSVAADLAADIGCEVAKGVTKKTTLFVVADQYIENLAGHDKHSKHLKAEEYIQRGIPIRILKESDFVELVRVSNDDIDS